MRSWGLFGCGGHGCCGVVVVVVVVRCGSRSRNTAAAGFYVQLLIPDTTFSSQTQDGIQSQDRNQPQNRSNNNNDDDAGDEDEDPDCPDTHLPYTNLHTPYTVHRLDDDDDDGHDLSGSRSPCR